MTRITFFASCFFILLLSGCASRPSEKDISKKILLEYVCNETAKVNDLKILRTEETESTGEPHVFRYSVRGVVEWPDGCTEMGTNTPPGTKEKIEKTVTLFKAEDGSWQ